MTRALTFSLTFLTGFSALVYQVAWQKYLATLLGSHSEATAAVLGIFLGGLSLGYALFGRVTGQRMRAAAESGVPANLLMLYGAVEASIGIYALCFPFLFRGAQWLTLQPGHLSSGPSFLLDVGISAVLIGLPVVLMGGTIPLLTQALASGLRDATRLHAYVYTFNTFGAFAGALAAGFYIIPELGLRGSVVSMGLVNLAAGLGFAVLGARTPGVMPTALAKEGSATHAGSEVVSGLVVALLSGFAMMTLQVAANRIGAFSLGSSQFTFSIVVAAFVFGIAAGSLAVTAFRSIPSFILPLSQWLLIATLLLLYFSVDDAPYWAHRLRVEYPSTPDAFLSYHAAVFRWLLAVSLLSIALSGATLPLIFHDLRRQLGELGSLAGRIYAWNTLGSLLGALVGGYLLLFVVDLHQVYRIAVGALVLGAWLLSARLGRPARNAGTVAAVICLATLVLLPTWSPKQLASGLFRRRQPMTYTGAGPESFFRHFNEERPPDYLAYYRDDPSVSVAVTKYAIAEDIVQGAVITNGKSDSSIPTDDRTTSLQALIPALFAERAERAFVVGIGTGMTASVLGSLESIREVHVAEISQAMIDALPYLDDLNGGLLGNPKVEIVRSDAYRALRKSEGRYDVIVSEPSNPWVAGVELLYTTEFLQSARDRLTPGGIYGQWFHTYEADEEVVSIILRTFRGVFENTSVWITQKGDLLLLGFNDPHREFDLDRLESRFSQPDFKAPLAKIGIREFGELLASEVLPAGVVSKMELLGPAHTLENPILSDRAARAFFVGHEAPLPRSDHGAAAEAGRRNSLAARYREKTSPPASTAQRVRQAEEICSTRPRSHCSTYFAFWLHSEPESPDLRRIIQMTSQSEAQKHVVEPGLMRKLAMFYGDVPVPQTMTCEEAMAADRLYARFYSHAIPFRADVLDLLWKACPDKDERRSTSIGAVL
ncbi:MAG TPA: fused MFS/spermidine synthase [Candidatus Binatia bacterium]|nr:fused MFS/spermidine synthase [Candidatus Binatia bacterium]